VNGLGADGNPTTDAEEQVPEGTLRQRVEGHFLGTMASGFVVLVPLLVTILILQFAFVYTDSIFRGEGGLLSRTPLNFPGIGVITLVVILYGMGLVVSGRVGRRRVVQWQGAVLSRIPIVRSIYGVAHQATEALASPGGHRFSRVVFLEWPRAGFMALGFVTGHCHLPEKQETLMVVYIPTVPNPTSGNLAFVSERDIIETDMTVEDAMKVVFSGGIVLPTTMGSNAAARRRLSEERADEESVASS
jgi:uncharacterized membrane protein